MNIAERQNQPLGRIGDLTVKIAGSRDEIIAAQKLRHKVFSASPESDLDLRDEDRFDEYCDHLIVVCSEGGLEKVVATYRLMGPTQAAAAGGYYSQNEFAVDELVARHPNLKFLEFGRSCVLPEFRTKRTVELLWHGSWAYVRKHGYDVMFGCASFPGNEIKDHANALSFLGRNAGPDIDWNVRGLGEAFQISALEEKPDIDLKSALRSLPPLIKGYLRLGAMFASDAVIDREFGTIDVLVLLPISKLNPRYVRYYGENAERHQ